MDERERKYNIKFDSQDKAIDVAKYNLDQRLSHLNELREEVVQDRGKFVTFSDMKIIETQLSNLSGSIKIIIPVTAIIAGLIGAIITNFLN